MSQSNGSPEKQLHHSVISVLEKSECGVLEIEIYLGNWDACIEK